MFRAISIASKHLALIMGDFNYPGINWVTLEAEPKFFGPDSGLFSNTHVSVPTRNKNILDLVMTTELD